MSRSEFKPARGVRAAASLCAVAAAFLLAGCNAASLQTGETMTQGYVIDEQTLELVPVGSSREQVLLALGTPSTTATFDTEVFYYISQTRKRGAQFMKPRLVDQRVLAVYFGPDSTVERLANYGLQDGRVFDFISRTTPTGGKDTSFLGQILAGGLGGASFPGTGAGAPGR